MCMNVCNDQIDVNNITIKISHKPLDMVKIYKYLGIFTYIQLNFQHHIKYWLRM